MAQTLHIAPVTRIEGHGKVTIHLDDAGRVIDARLHVTEFRGFEKFCEGRMFQEMPGLTMRICGICPVSHMLASAKACDAILGVRVPAVAVKLRRLINYAQYVQSHALSFFYLSAPDLLLGVESDPAARNITGLVQADPELARKAIRLRRFGQEIIRMIAGKSVHPAWATPGGVRTGMTEDQRAVIRGMLPEAFHTTEIALDLLKDRYDGFQSEIENYGDFPSLFIGLVTPEGGLEHYDGVLRVMDADGKLLESGLAPERRREIIAEAVEPWSYLKFPYYKPYGYRNGGGEGNESGDPGGDGSRNGDVPGMYRVGPLARLNICDFAGTVRADRELTRFRSLRAGGKPVTGSFHYHYARLIEILFALEKIEELLDDPEITGAHIRSRARLADEPVGIGVMEAPRGTLIHEYHVDDNGILTGVNLIVATGNNNLAMNATIRRIAGAYLRGHSIGEGLLNRIEHGIRLYDPCLSCSTHAVGKMPFHVRIYDVSGNMVAQLTRD